MATDPTANPVNAFRDSPALRGEEVTASDPVELVAEKAETPAGILPSTNDAPHLPETAVLTEVVRLAGTRALMFVTRPLEQSVQSCEAGSELSRGTSPVPVMRFVTLSTVISCPVVVWTEVRRLRATRLFDDLLLPTKGWRLTW